MSSPRNLAPGTWQTGPRPLASGSWQLEPDFPFFAPMKVLIIHQHFKTPATGGAIRSYYLAKALVENGIETVVITAHNGLGRTDVIDGITVHYVSVAYDNRFGFNRRVFSFSRFAMKAVQVASKHRDADLCYAISTPLTTGLVARRIRAKLGIPYIFEVGDLWPDAPVQMGFITNPLLKRVLYRLERRIYRDATSVVALSEPIGEAIRKRVPAKVVHVLPNMADTNFFTPVDDSTRDAAKRAFRVEGKLVVSYIGALGIANGLHHFLACAAASLRENLPVHFLLCGDGAMTDALNRKVKELGLTNLTIVPFQDREGVRAVMTATDVNFISYLPVKILETGCPNKYFDGLAAGKLTMVNFSGWVRDEIARERCGVYVDVNDPDDFVRRIHPFLADSTMLKAYGQAGRVLALRKYSREELGSTFVDILRRSRIH